MLLAYKLVAHGIGGRTVRELYGGPGANDEGMDVDEFLTWAAYLSMHPLPEDRADYHVGMLMAQQYNMNRGKGKPTKGAADFRPVWHEPPREPQTGEQARQALMAWYLHLGGDPEALN